MKVCELLQIALDNPRLLGLEIEMVAHKPIEQLGGVVDGAKVAFVHRLESVIVGEQGLLLCPDFKLQKKISFPSHQELEKTRGKTIFGGPIPYWLK